MDDKYTDKKTDDYIEDLGIKEKIDFERYLFLSLLGVNRALNTPEIQPVRVYYMVSFLEADIRPYATDKEKKTFDDLDIQYGTILNSDKKMDKDRAFLDLSWRKKAIIMEIMHRLGLLLRKVGGMKL